MSEKQLQSIWNQPKRWFFKHKQYYSNAGILSVSKCCQKHKELLFYLVFFSQLTGSDQHFHEVFVEETSFPASGFTYNCKWPPLTLLISHHNDDTKSINMHGCCVFPLISGKATISLFPLMQPKEREREARSGKSKFRRSSAWFKGFPQCYCGLQQQILKHGRRHRVRFMYPLCALAPRLCKLALLCLHANTDGCN